MAKKSIFEENLNTNCGVDKGAVLYTRKQILNKGSVLSTYEIVTTS